MRPQCKTLFLLLALAAGGCTTNRATGESQFAGLMSPSREESLGAEENRKIMAAFGATQSPMQGYVEQVGHKVTADTERPEVSYKFFVLDTPIVNAFALPGGYIYVTRGLLAQANDESELAAVLAHETGHITARHAAVRYSQGMLASLGTAIVAASAGGSAMAQVADFGPDIFTRSYSRAQEGQADELGIRYLSRAGYDPLAMARFLQALQAQDDLQHKLDGKGNAGSDFFSTHPGTADRVLRATAEAAKYPQGKAVTGRAEYLKAVDGLVYGDSDRQGFSRGRTFWHPAMDFTFTVPEGFSIDNQSTQVVAKGPGGAIVILDSVDVDYQGGPGAYLREKWMRGEKLEDEQDITVDGSPAAAASFPGRVGGRPVTIRIAAVQWAPAVVFRFQIALPKDAAPKLSDELANMIRSLRRMSDDEKRTMHPWHVHVVTASAGDTAASLAAQMPFDKLKEQRFRVLNGLKPDEKLSPGQACKIVTEN